ncbi:hypothetical protein K1719_004354 [Acacia pycnantha]|nr:hypothetical protein K1719_004354 [Acacia pycnantha]
MGKKPQILPSLFRAPPRKLPWQFFPPCALSPKTLSFRATASAGEDIFRTVNSVYFDPVDTPDPWFTTSSESAASFTTEDDVDRDTCTEESVEMVVRGVRSSERLFFDPDDTRSILEQAKAGMGFPFKESEFLAMESEDPYGDFRRSMEEMVESHGVRDWEGLEELLGWYLKVNGKNNHAFIVEAFVDLLVSLSKKKNPVSPSSTSNYSSAISSFSSSSSLRDEVDDG